MKKLLFFASLFALAACTNDVKEEQSVTDETTTVTIGFSGFQIEQTAMSRAATSVTDYTTHLDIWIYESGNEFASFHQATGDEGFGSLSVTLSLAKTYTLYAVAHKANGPATLSDGVISFVDDKVTHSFFVKQTFTPTKGMSLNLTMNRIVAQFQFTTADAVPDWCKTMRFTISNVYDRWNVNTGGTHQLDRVSTFQNFSTKADGTVTFNIYAIVTDESTNHDILVEGLNADGEVKEYHQFEDVPLRNNYRTIATGNFFTDAASSFSFLAEEWGSDIEYNF